MSARLNAEVSINGGVSASASVGVKTISASATVCRAQSFTPYTGEYEFTPSSETQTIPIYNKIASADIVINPIPSNYGLISWNGSTLTVS